MGFYDSYGRHIDYAGTEYFRRCRFKGGSSTTVNNTTTYTPTEYELELQKAQANYSNAIAPNALWLNNTARNVLQDSLGTVQVDFNGLNRNAQNQINNANGQLTNIASGNTTAANRTNNSLSGLGSQYTAAANRANNSLTGLGSQLSGATTTANNKLASLETGALPTAYQRNMENSIASALQRTMGNTVNNLANRGVINSSVANSAMNDISRNAADTVAQQYGNNISQIAGLANQQYGNQANTISQQANLAQQQYGNTNSTLGNIGNLAQQQYGNSINANNANANIYNNAINNATAGITTAAAAQEAAQQPALNLWNASLGLNGATTGALAAAAGKGTTTTNNTSTTSGGGGFFSGLLGGL